MCKGTISKSFQHLDILVQLLERDGVEFTLDPTTRRFVSTDLDKAGLMEYLERVKNVAKAQKELTDALRWWGQHDLGNVAGHAWKGHMTLSLDRVAANCVEDPTKAISALALTLFQMQSRMTCFVMLHWKKPKHTCSRTRDCSAQWYTLLASWLDLNALFRFRLSTT